MRMYHTRAIVLQKDEWSEADWMVSAFTEDFGKLRLLARGARRHGAKLQGHLEPGAVASFSFVAGRSGYRLTGARILDPLSATRTSLPKTRARASVLATLEQTLLFGGDRPEELFGLVVVTLGTLETCEDDALPRLSAWFTARFLHYLGLLPAGDSLDANGLTLLLDLASRRPDEIASLSLSPGSLRHELGGLSALLGRAVTLPHTATEGEFAV